MTTHDALQVLDLATPITRESLTEAYEQGVQVWQPERFEGNEGLQARARAKVNELYAAYLWLYALPKSEFPYAVADAAAVAPAPVQVPEAGQTPPVLRGWGSAGSQAGRPPVPQGAAPVWQAEVVPERPAAELSAHAEPPPQPLQPDLRQPLPPLLLHSTQRRGAPVKKPQASTATVTAWVVGIVGGVILTGVCATLFLSSGKKDGAEETGAAEAAAVAEAPAPASEPAPATASAPSPWTPLALPATGGALAALRERAERGDAESQYQMGLSLAKGAGAPQDAAVWFFHAARRGHAKAQTQAGIACFTGQGAPKDVAEAMLWCSLALGKDAAADDWLTKIADALTLPQRADVYQRVAEFRALGPEVPLAPPFAVSPWREDMPLTELRQLAEQGDALAQFHLGEACRLGKGMPVNAAEAAEWFRKSADRGNAEALDALGLAYYLGRSVPQNDDLALGCFRQAAAQGHAGSQYILGCEYMDGNAIARDPEVAVAWLLKAAEQGHGGGQMELGRAYLSGKGVAKDPTLGVLWLNRAATQGLDEAQFEMGICWEDGVGVGKDATVAAEWHKKAAVQGHAKAQTYLGTCYIEGNGVAKDEAEGLKWYRKAAEQDHPAGQYGVGLCYAAGFGVAKNATEAVKWYRLAADQGNLAAQNNLGFSYEYGEGVAADPLLAVQWYRKAAERGFFTAQHNLGNCYAAGCGVPKDDVEAMKWYLLAAAQGDLAAADWAKDLDRKLTREQHAEAEARAAEFRKTRGQ